MSAALHREYGILLGIGFSGHIGTAAVAWLLTLQLVVALLLSQKHRSHRCTSSRDAVPE